MRMPEIASYFGDLGVRGPVIKVQLLDSNGKPYPGVSVYAENDTEFANFYADMGSAKADGNGQALVEINTEKYSYKMVRIRPDDSMWKPIDESGSQTQRWEPSHFVVNLDDIPAVVTFREDQDRKASYESKGFPFVPVIIAVVAAGVLGLVAYFALRK